MIILFTSKQKENILCSSEEVIFFPLFRTIINEEKLTRLRRLAHFDDSILLFTSVNAAKIFLDNIAMPLLNEPEFSFAISYACVGKETKKLFDGYGAFTCIGLYQNSMALCTDLNVRLNNKTLPFQNFTYICSKSRLPTIENHLKCSALEIFEIYDSVPIMSIDQLDAKLNDLQNLQSGDWLVFFNPKGFECVFESEFIRNCNRAFKIAAIGQTTANTIMAKNLNVHLIADFPSTTQLIKQIIHYGRCA